MDFYKYITFAFILITITVMSATMSSPDEALSDYFGSTQNDALNDQVRSGAGDLSDPDYAYTPQNDNTEGEGTGGVSASRTTQEQYGTIAKILTFITAQQDQARSGQESSDSFGAIMWVAIGLFWAIIGAFGILKLVNFIKNKDTS